MLTFMLEKRKKKFLTQTEVSNKEVAFEGIG